MKPRRFQPLLCPFCKCNLYVRDIEDGFIEYYCMGCLETYAEDEL